MINNDYVLFSLTKEENMKLWQMGVLTASIWVITFALCIMFHSFGFLDKETASGIVGGGTFFSAVAWFFWVLGRPSTY